MLVNKYVSGKNGKPLTRILKKKLYGPYVDLTSVWYDPVQPLPPSPNLPLPRGRFCLQSEWGQWTKTGGAVQGSAGQCRAVLVMVLRKVQGSEGSEAGQPVDVSWSVGQ